MTQVHAATPTLILKDAPYTTDISFLHVSEDDQGAAVDNLIREGQHLAALPGFMAVNVLRSTDGTRICSYIQWQSEATLTAARTGAQDLTRAATQFAENDSAPRLYDVIYADDRSQGGVSVISADDRGVIFINEITTRPDKQDRLLELVIANNVKASLHTPGYRSANFHKSRDGQRAVNYSLWDTEEHLIQSISEMAAMDVNLEETIEIASPDFRFYTLAYSAHA